MNKHRFPYKWILKDYPFKKNKGKVFSCFACGGGSTMGYKLAGFDVIGCNEIDPRMNKIYVMNHHPKYNYLEGIQTFKLRNDLPRELYQLDILDGSPPCSSFSMSGIREDGWGVEKVFREGQSNQILDTLFFDFIDLAKKLQPKIVIAENVKGLLLGDAINYVRRIYEDFNDANYELCHYLCDASTMGVPQRRERVFFFAIRKDLFEFIPHRDELFQSFPSLNLDFKEQGIIYGEFCDEDGRDIKGKMRELWENKVHGDTSMSDAWKRESGKTGYFSQSYIYKNAICSTLTGHEDSLIPYDKPKYTSQQEVCCMSTFPLDYNFGKEKAHYICGMSVPPVMMAQIASSVYEQWLSKIVQKIDNNTNSNSNSIVRQLSIDFQF